MPTTIFWPKDVRYSGFCYGWTTPAICVIGVLKVRSEQDAILAVHNLCHSPRWKPFAASCGNSEPVLIGKCEFNETRNRRELLLPVLKLRIPIDYVLIYYTRHDSKTLRFYSLDVPRLDASSREEVVEGSAYLASLQHDFTAPTRNNDNSSLNDTIVNQFNSAKMLDQILQGHKNKSIFGTSFSAFLGSSSDPPKFLVSISHILTSLYNIPVIPFSSTSLKDILSTFQQLDVRAEQLDFFVNEIGTLRQYGSTPIPPYSTRYTNFFNSVWLIMNDITLGIALGTFICENYMIVSGMLTRTMEGSLINWVQWALRWLDSWPAGLKLNTELSRFYSHSFIGLVIAWRSFLLRCEPYLPTIIYVIGILSHGGITFSISLVLDMLGLLTIHIYICYVISGAVYQKMLRTAGSLWNLFRGKRYNVLRKRTDSWEYDIDQLLFGTILFTLLAFLFPTVLAYYALFALMRLGVLVIQACLETLLALMNHFPLFALMLRVKDPWRLPGGVYFLPVKVLGSSYPLLEIKNQPVPLSSIFFEYIQLLWKLAAHYNPLRLFGSVLLGQHLAAIPGYSIRYKRRQV